MKPDEQRRYYPILERMRAEVLSNARRTRGEVRFDPDDAADELDAASSESGRGFIGHLRDRERGLLVKIELAIDRIERGTFGTCRECEEDIAPSRLAARPVAELCFDCKTAEERRPSD